MFFLQGDGRWIEESSNACRPLEERFQIVFDTLAEVMAVLGKLTGTPEVERIQVAAADLEAYIARLKVSTTEQIIRTFLSHYRAGKRPA